MTMETEFYIKIALTFAASGVIFFLMHRAQKRKEEAAEKVFQRTLQMIELRNRRIDDSVSSDSKKD